MVDHIIYQSGDFGIYDVNSMKVLECIYAYNHSKFTSLPIEKSFLIKTGRKPNDYELNYITKIKNGDVKVPNRLYISNWSVYAAQNILLEHPILVPSSKEIQKFITEAYGHSISIEDFHYVSKLVRYKINDLNQGYYAINVWQIMGVIGSLEALNSPKNEYAISLLFNKIYKRDPLDFEIDLCSRLSLSDMEEMESEIESAIQLKNKLHFFSFKRSRERYRQICRERNGWRRSKS